MKPFERGSPAPSRSQASSSRSSSSNHESQELSDLVMETLRRAHDDVERQVSRKLESAFASQTQLKKELSEVKSKNSELEKDLAKMTSQKKHVTEAFENGRKELAKFKTEAALQAEEIARLRKAVEDLQAERQATNFGREIMHAEFSALEVERDVVQRALGAATKQLFGKQQQQLQQQEKAAAAAMKGGRTGTQMKGRPAGKPLGSSPRLNTPTGGVRGSGSRGNSPARSAWN